MKVRCVLTFDLKDEETADYAAVYDAIRELGFETSLKASNGKTYVLPSTICVGNFEGESVESVRDHLIGQVKTKMEEIGVSAYIFLETSSGGHYWKLAVTGAADYHILD